MQHTDESVDSTNKVLVSIIDVGEFVKQREIIWELKHHDISRAYFQGTMENLIHT